MKLMVYKNRLTSQSVLSCKIVLRLISYMKIPYFVLTRNRAIKTQSCTKLKMQWLRYHENLQIYSWKMWIIDMGTNKAHNKVIIFRISHAIKLIVVLQQKCRAFRIISRLEFYYSYVTIFIFKSVNLDTWIYNSSMVWKWSMLCYKGIQDKFGSSAFIT